MNKKITLIAVALLTVTLAFAGGKAKILSGNLSFLKGEKLVNVKYVYDGTTVGKFKNENDYLAKKAAEYDKKEPGRGDKFKQSWAADRPSRFEPKFEQLLNENVNKKGVTFGKFPDAKYTLIVKTTLTEPGYNIVVSRKPAIVNTQETFVETKGGKEVAKLQVIGSTGTSFGGYDYDTGVRLSEAYAKTGKEFGQLLAKLLK